MSQSKGKDFDFVDERQLQSIEIGSPEAYSLLNSLDTEIHLIRYTGLTTAEGFFDSEDLDLEELLDSDSEPVGTKDYESVEEFRNELASNSSLSFGYDRIKKYENNLEFISDSSYIPDVVMEVSW